MIFKYLKILGQSQIHPYIVSASYCCSDKNVEILCQKFFFTWSFYNNISELNQVFSITSDILDQITFINAARNCCEEMVLSLNLGSLKYSLVQRAMFTIFIIVIINIYYYNCYYYYGTPISYNLNYGIQIMVYFEII